MRQFGIAGIGAQGIHREVGAEIDQAFVVLPVDGVEPLEGVVLVTQIGIELRDCIRRRVLRGGFTLRKRDFNGLAQSARQPPEWNPSSMAAPNSAWFLSACPASLVSSMTSGYLRRPQYE